MGRLVRYLKAIILVGLLSVSHVSYGQSAQDFVKAFETYQTQFPSQQLQLIFNQSKYSPGDTVFFKAYLFKGDHALWKGAQIVEANLISPKGKSVMSLSFKTENGVGYNQFTLSSELEAGFYTVLAFTNWMKNFGLESMFQQSVEVVADNAISRVLKPIILGIEGGSLIDEVPANIVVKSANSGETISLFNESEFLIDSISTDLNGFGRLRFVPSIDQKYFIRNSEGERVSLIDVEPFGFTISISFVSEELIRLRVLGKPLANQGGQLNLIMSSNDRIYHSQAVDSSEPFQILVDRKTLSPGTHDVSLIDSKGILVSSREFFVAQSSDISVNLEIDGNPITPRAAVKVEVNLADASGAPIAGEFSLSVTNGSVLYNENQAPLEYMLNLPNWQEINFEEDLSTDQVFNTIDNQLILNPKPIDWEAVLSKRNTLPDFDYTSMFQLNGRAYNAKTNEPLTPNTTLMFYLQKDLMRYEVSLGYEGRFYLNVLDVFGEDEILVMAETENGEEILDVNIEWQEKGIREFPIPPKFKVSGEQDNYAYYRLKDAKIKNSFGFFSSSEDLDSLAESQRSRAPQVAILETDYSMKVDDFFLFPTMSQFMKETVRPLRVGSRGNEEIVRVKFLEPGTTGDPLYIIDGIATKNTAFFLSLNPTDLQTIEVIKYPKKLSRFGLMAKNGIVIVNSKVGDKREPLNPENIIQGLNSPIGLKALDKHWADHSVQPEFRSTLYWAPTIKTDEKGKAVISFYTSDDATPLQIRIDGIANGKSFSFNQTLKTSENANN